ncbi:transcriptional regulator [Stenotrophomonas maltophilia group sp. Smal35]|uniref:transcriptional regulator n=1 Tax=Stenotrophomonas maltophilia group sp. Smal35 TaxID=3377163 RepID=UPI0025531263|nr:Cro/CI family transcriptional regulator [Stenotrophomonas maltophilia]
MDALDKAVKAAGGVTSLAIALGVRQSAVSNWKSRSRIPAAQAIRIERATGVSRHDLCPEIFGVASHLVPVTKQQLMDRLGFASDGHLAKVLGLPVEDVAKWPLLGAVPALPQVLLVLGIERPVLDPIASKDLDHDRIVPVDAA